MNGWNSGLIACSLITWRSCEDRLAKGRSSKGKGTIVWQCLSQEQIREGNLENCRRGRVFWTTDVEEYKTTDLVWELKRKFGLVIKLKAIKNTMEVSHLFIFQLKAWSCDLKPLDLDFDLICDLISLFLTSCHCCWLVTSYSSIYASRSLEP